ncbi:MAG: hypothetical protein WC529_02005 [Candidatus Margulisiibacteriota bacterium]
MTVGRRAALICLAIYLLSFGLLYYAHSVRVEKDPGLTGEELAIAYRDVYLLPTRSQHNYYATTFSSAVYYWVGSYLLPITVNSQRLFKIAGMAFLPLLIVLLMRTIRPPTSWLAASSAALLFCAMPPVIWFSIMVQDFPTDCVFSFLALLLAFRFSWRDQPLRVAGGLTAIGLLIVWFVHFYGGSFVLALIIPLLLGWKALTGEPADRPRDFFHWSLFALLTFVLLWWPKLYFGPAVVMFNGGRHLTLSWPAVAGSFAVICRDLLVASDSYLLRPWLLYACLPGLWYQLLFAGLLLAGLRLLWREKNRYLFWLLALAVGSFLLGGLFGDVPGIRRIFPCLIVCSCWAGYGVEAVGRLAGGKLWQGILVALLVGYSLFIFHGTYRFVSLDYRNWLQREFTYLPGKNYEGTIEGLIAESQKRPVKMSQYPKSPDVICHHHDTYLLLKLFCARRGLSDKGLIWVN